MAIVINGTTGVTFPVVAGGTSALQASSGKVLQVVQTSTNTYTGTTSTTYADATNLTVTITPSSSTSKILVLCDLAYYNQSDNSTTLGVQLVRSGTAIWTNDYFHNFNVNANVASYAHSPINYLDSPATTSATTYKIQIKRTSSAGTSYAPGINTSSANQSSSITVLEIAA